MLSAGLSQSKVTCLATREVALVKDIFLAVTCES